ncbi:MAG: hypothetical protein HN348_28155, partial [Proteobacteria bacterium]|nr:hypothetical protein [Pseudomonadota bacterium]
LSTSAPQVDQTLDQVMTEATGISPNAAHAIAQVELSTLQADLDGLSSTADTEIATTIGGLQPIADAAGAASRLVIW